MAHEIERKFLVDTFPEHLKEKAGKTGMEQGYLALEKDGHEVRLRRTDDRCLLTVKSTGNLARKEYETELSAEQFEVLWPATEGRRLQKDRYVFEEAGVEVEVDIYHRPLRGLIVAEVEFDSKATAEAYEKPDWMGREVTDLSFLKNRRLLEFESYEELKEQALG